MNINYYPDKEIEALKQQLHLYENDDSVKGVLLLTCDANGYTKDSLTPVLKSQKKPVFGGIFPAIMFNRKKHDYGFILAGFDKEPIVNTIESISSLDTDFDEILINISESHKNTRTMFVFVDGFAERISAFIESIFTIFGIEFNYIGGGAGSLSLKQKPCVISNAGLLEDATVIVGFNIDSGIGVKHGWESIAGPFKITDAKKNTIKELDFKPAYFVYKEIVERYLLKELNPEHFFEMAKAFPFGINKIDAERVVRDPLAIGENNSLVCVGEVETGSFVDILTGDKNMLIEAAGDAIKMALENKQQDPCEFIFFIDCISRVLFLESDFNKELENVLNNYDKVPLIGALTMGEIANNGKDYLEFYNKTSVVGCF